MKKNITLIFIIIILLVTALIMYHFAFSEKAVPQNQNFSEIKQYIKDIYGTTFLIPEFNDINDADEDWLWENVNQYVWNHDDEYHEKNEQEYGYTYEDISKIVKTLYGENLKKKFPKGAIAMRYNSYRELYGPTAFGITNYYDYKIDKISQNGTTYTISLYDFTISTEKFSGEDESDDYFEIFNNYDYMLNGDNANILLKVKTLDDDKFKNILDFKDKLSHKVLTIEYDEAENLYYITSCIYKDVKDSEILATMYHKMQKTFEIMSIDYKYEDIYVQDEVIVNNFDELASIYTENSLQTYKDEMDIFVYKDNGDVYITAGDITVGDYLSKIEFENIDANPNKITCNVIRTFRESFDPTDNKYDKTYKKENLFSIVKENGTWLIDEFSYNK